MNGPFTEVGLAQERAHSFVEGLQRRATAAHRIDENQQLPDNEIKSTPITDTDCHLQNLFISRKLIVKLKSNPFRLTESLVQGHYEKR